MAYSIDFFALQLKFAEQVASQFSMDFETVLHNYTTLSKTLASGSEWEVYIRGLERATDRIDWTRQFYEPRRGAEQVAEATHFQGHTLFGCFYFELRDGFIVRPHFVKNDLSGFSPLGAARFETRIDDLTRMFTHIREFHPEAKVVLGNTWMFNLEAYRRLYPPTYTENRPPTDEDEFQFLALWGQYFDRSWKVKKPLAEVLFERLATLSDVTKIRDCFPYQVLCPSAPIQQFYDWYEIA